MEQIVFIDSGLNDVEGLIASLPAELEVVVLRPDADGLRQIASVLGRHQGVGAIHLFSHGSPGRLQLGNGTLSERELADHLEVLQTIGASLAPNADVLLYGCDVAQGHAGRSFLAALASATGADIAASTDRTGSALAGGNWWLEAMTGTVNVASLQVSVSGTLASIVGTASDDILNGTAGDDSLFGGAGNDTLRGGTGFDTAIVSGEATDFKLITTVNGFISLKDMNSDDGDEGSDTLVSIQQIEFNDREYSIEAIGTGFDRRVNSYTDGNQEEPTVTALLNGGYVAVWQSRIQNGIFGQRFDSAGVPADGEFKVNSTVDGLQLSPSVASLSNGGFIVGWQTYGVGNFAQKYNITGVPQGGQFKTGVNNTSDGLPTIVGLSDGGFASAWNGSGGSYIQFYGANSTVPSPFRALPGPTYSGTSNFTNHAALAQLAAGDLVYSWISYTNENGYEIKAARLDVSGALIDAPFQVNTTTLSHQIAPTVSPLTNGGFVIAWQSYNSISRYDIVSRVYGADGLPRTSEITVNTGNANEQQNPSIATLNSGDFIVVWQSSLAQAASAGGIGIFARQFDTNGVARTDEFQVSSSGSETWTDPNVVSLGDGGFVISWQSTDSNGRGIFSKYFNAEGQAVGGLKLSGSGLDDIIDLSSISPTAILDGADGNDHLIGSNGNDVILGGNGGDLLDGGLGRDSLNGGLGNDIYIIDSFDDVVVETNSDISEIDTIRTNLSKVLGSNVENLELLGSLAVNATGNSLNNVLVGNSASNRVDGGFGVDTMQGGDGSDTYVVDNSADVIIESNSAQAVGGSDIVEAYASYVLSENIEGVRIFSNDQINITGNAGRNIIYSGAGSNTINGAGGVDTVSYRYSSSGVAVSLDTNTPQSTIGSGVDTLLNIEYLTGSNFDDVLSGDRYGNGLDGGIGADIIFGGDGNDVYYLDDVNDRAIEANADSTLGGIDLVISIASVALDANIENLRLLAGTIHGTGNDIGNIIYSGPGNNVLNGMGGVDTVSYLYATARVTVALLPNPQATGGAGFDSFLNIENIEGSNFDDVITGDSYGNTLNGGLGGDTLTGGNGSDFYVVDNGRDVVVETNPATIIGGIDVVQASIDYVLGDNIENLRLNSVGSINGRGNSLDNVLYATIGNNVVDGDQGRDTVSYEFSASPVVLNLAITLPQNTVGSGFDTIIGIENATGTSFNDVLTGNSGGNVLAGGAGADVLNGGLGMDTLIGGDGYDNYYVDSLFDVVLESNANSAVGGIDTVYANASTVLSANVENARILSPGTMGITGNELQNIIYAGSGSNYMDGADGQDTVSFVFSTSGVNASLGSLLPQSTGGSGVDTLTNFESLFGSRYADILEGNSSNNTISGDLGADTMVGGDGSDTYFVDNVGDVIVESNNDLLIGGVDFINTSVSLTIPSGVENARITSSGAVNVIGNDLDNIIYSGPGGNIIQGGAGSDTISYAWATLPVNISLKITVAQSTGGSGIDNISDFENLNGGSGNDTLRGDDGDNSIIGGAGNDSLFGGSGNDILSGLMGSDTFVFDSQLNVLTNVDRIAYFESGIDKFRLEPSVFIGIGAPGAVSSDALALGVNATDTNHRIIYDSELGLLYFDSDGSGGASQVLFSSVPAGTSLVASDFWIGG